MSRRNHYKYIIGVDEAGRGPLAGPIAVGVLLIKSNGRQNIFRGIKNSKHLSEKQREKWFEKFNEEKKRGKLSFAISMVSSEVIDEVGIVRATRMAVRRSMRRLNVNPKECKVLLDGSLYAPKTYPHQKTYIKGDERIKIIAAASIIAKVKRDRKMKIFAKKYPGYKFEKHKGYGTKKHYKSLKKRGLSQVHRKTFIS